MSVGTVKDSDTHPIFIWTFLALNPVRILPLSSFHEPIHVRGYFLVSDLRIYLRAIDVCVSHHLGDAFYRNTGGHH